MTQRDILVSLVDKAKEEYANDVTDHTETDYIVEGLLNRGVIVPPCKVGTVYYTVEKFCNTDPFETEKELVHPGDCENYCGRSDCPLREFRIVEHEFSSVIQILLLENFFDETIFLTHGEAEKALAEKCDK